MIIHYLVYFPAIVNDYDLIINNYFVLLDISIDKYVLVFMKPLVGILIIILEECCKDKDSSLFSDIRKYLLDDNTYIVKEGYNIAKKNHFYIDDDLEDSMLKELKIYNNDNDEKMIMMIVMIMMIMMIMVIMINK